MTRLPAPLRRTSVALLVAGLIALGASEARALPEDRSLLQEGGTGASAAVVSLFYSPVKLLYAVGGLTVACASFLWTWGDRDTAMTVVTTSLGGDYVITPEHLLGRRDFRFTGG
jgi:hypothetical protein